MSGVAERVRRFRERQKSGAIVLPPVTVADEAGLLELLADSGVFNPVRGDDKSAIASATGQLLDALVEQHLKGFR